MVRGDVKAWLQASGWKLEKRGHRWFKDGLALVVYSSSVRPEMVSWSLFNQDGVLRSGYGVTETLYKLLNDID